MSTINTAKIVSDTLTQLSARLSYANVDVSAQYKCPEFTDIVDATIIKNQCHGSYGPSDQRLADNILKINFETGEHNYAEMFFFLTKLHKMGHLNAQLQFAKRTYWQYIEKSDWDKLREHVISDRYALDLLEKIKPPPKSNFIHTVQIEDFECLVVTLELPIYQAYAFLEQVDNDMFDGPVEELTERQKYLNQYRKIRSGEAGAEVITIARELNLTEQEINDGYQGN